MSKQTYFGVTVFGYLAIAASLIVIFAHIWLLHMHQTPAANMIIGGLFLVTVIGFALIRFNRNWWVQTIRQIAYIWSFASLLAAALFVLSWLLEVDISPWKIWLFDAGVLAAGYYKAGYANVRSKKIINDFPSQLTVAHISDLHLGDIWGKKDVDKVVRRINKHEPDIVFITGDVVDGLPEDTDKLAGLKSITAPTYSVIGNHDVYASKSKVKDQLRAAGVEVLENDLMYECGLPIIGLKHKENYEKLSELIQQTKKHKSAVVLKHEPDIPQNVITNEIVLCGHVHAGQVWPLHYLGAIEFSHLTGSYAINDGLLYVHPGTRTWGPPFRLGTSSEITFFELIPAKNTPAREGGEEQTASQ